MRFMTSLAIGLVSFQTLLVGLVTIAADNSPASEVVAYVSPGKVDEDIFVLDVNRGLAHDLTRWIEQSHEREPAWSPDGSRIAFSSWHPRFRVANIFVMDFDSGHLSQLTRLDTDYDFSPAWSPDGRQLAYVSRRGNRVRISVMDADGQNKHSITAALIPTSSPSWSGDGESIVFTRYVESSGDHLYIVDADGSAARQFIEGSYIYPVWSPDGAWIAFLGRDHQTRRILVMEKDSGQLREFTVPAGNFALTWLPDSRHIAFVGPDCTCRHEVYLLDIESGEQRRFPFGGSLGSVPVWRPT